MKNILKYAALLLLAGFTLTGCETETTPERKVVQHPEDQTPLLRDNAYYARLRAYKKTKHKIAFGWFGSWNPENASKMATLNHAPDSMDIISIWSQWHSLTPSQKKDKEFVQKVKGTKVTFTIFAEKVPEIFWNEGQIDSTAIANYAKAYAKDSMDKYQYDGIDLDYEPGYGASGPLVGHNNELMKLYCQELSKYVGPKSGTGRLLMIDGVPYALHTEIAELFDYGIVQAYYSGGYWDLQSRFKNAYEKGWKPEQYIFAEDFEKGWQKGGVTHQTRDGQYVPSLYGMALFDPEQGTGGGFGAYHMEYEYGHNDMVYKFMRNAIQLVNPAPAGDLTKTLVSINEAADMETFQIDQTPSGHVYGEVATEITGKLSGVPAADTDIKLTLDNEYVAAYNAENDTEYKTLDLSAVSISGDLHFPAGEQYTSAPVSITVPGVGTLDNGDYMIVVRPDVAQSKEYGTNEKAPHKILIINKAVTHIKVSVMGDAVSNFTIMNLLDGTLGGEVKTNVAAKLSLPAITAIDMNFVADNELGAAYNELHGTDYTVVDAANVSVTGKLHADQGETAFTGTVNVTVQGLDQIELGHAIVALRPDLSSLQDYKADERLGTKYLVIEKLQENVAPAQNLAEFKDNSVLIDNAGNKLEWVLNIQNLNSAGGSGVWYFDDNTGMMFDGNTAGGWYAIFTQSYCWQKGSPDGQLTLDMQKNYTVGTVLWSACYASAGYGVKEISSILTSVDGRTWTRHNFGNVTIAKGEDSYQWFTFVKPVEARYIRFVVFDGYDGTFCGMSEMEIWAPKN